MDDKYYNISYAESPFGTLNQYMTRTFAWMFAGLLVTFGVMMAVGTSYTAMNLLWGTGLVYLLTIAELVLVVVFSFRIEKMAPGTATGIFFLYSILNGVNLSVYFIVYDLSTLIFAFLIGAAYFGVMAVYGWRTENDLTGWGPKLTSALIVILIASLVGIFFMGFTAFDLLICAVALVVFMGFTAYDTQKLKYYYSRFGGDAVMLHKSAIYGALNLYLDFINIFLYVLRFLGRRRD